MPWTSWKHQIEKLQKKYYVVALALDVYIENQKSEFYSIEDEANKILDWFISQQRIDIHAVYGLSMGGAIAYKLATKNVLKYNI